MLFFFTKSDLVVVIFKGIGLGISLVSLEAQHLMASIIPYKITPTDLCVHLYGQLYIRFLSSLMKLSGTKSVRTETHVASDGVH
jgi:hypothetical protein